MAKRHEKISLKEMNQTALAHRTTYAELQKRETADMIEPIRVPQGYRKAGERRREHENT